MGCTYNGFGFIRIGTQDIPVDYSLLENNSNPQYLPTEVESIKVEDDDYQDRMALFQALGQPVILTLQNSKEIEIILYHFKDSKGRGDNIFSGAVLPGQKII